MPSAEPTWRIVEFVPDARPDFSGGMSPSTMLVSCAVANPTPMPVDEERRGEEERVHVDADEERRDEDADRLEPHADA